MIGSAPKRLEDEWLGLLTDVARAHRLVPLTDAERLGPAVAKLAAAYNDPVLRGLEGVDHLAARLGFSFPRDVPKVAGAVREVVAMGRIAMPTDRALRVLDLGAGLGASHRGLMRALDAAGVAGSIDVLAIDRDTAALAVAKEIATRRPREGGIELKLRVDSGSAAGYSSRHRYDVVLLGQVLSELDLELADEVARTERHRSMIASLLHDTMDDRGVLVIVEPALRPRSRHLQRVREALIAHDEAIVLAPCLHRGECPLLVRATDWCHEDLDVDLPPWLSPIAKRAQLRWEGLTFSYLVLSRRGPTLRDMLPSVSASASASADVAMVAIERAVSAPLVSKGKRELIVCGDPLRPELPLHEAFGPHGLRLGRLDREESAANASLDDLGRGDVLEVRGAIDDKGRVRRDDVIAACTKVVRG